MKNHTVAVLTAVMVVAAVISFAQDPVIGPGKRVKLDYTLFVDNEEMETSVGKEPLEYSVGDETIIPGLEAQLNGMHVGEEKVVMVDPKDAYGDPDTSAVKEFPKASMPKESEPKVGMVLQAKAPDGEEFPAMIKEIKDDKVVLDFNHPLAGKQLKFNVKVLNIEDAPAPEPEAVPAEEASPAVPEEPAAAAPAAE